MIAEDIYYGQRVFCKRLGIELEMVSAPYTGFIQPVMAYGVVVDLLTIKKHVPITMPICLLEPIGDIQPIETHIRWYKKGILCYE